MTAPRLFHISEDPGIKVFKPRPSPSYFEAIKGDVVFAIADTLLHNYLLPRDCPRVTFYANNNTAQSDKEKFFGTSPADFVIAIEEKWYSAVQQAILYCYEFAPGNFSLLDNGAGYYISYTTETPVACCTITDILKELQARKVELRRMDTLWPLARQVSQSTLQYSLIRMRNALPEEAVL
ncbi:DUF6886 family protein [Ferruginibacter sp.]